MCDGNNPVTPPSQIFLEPDLHNTNGFDENRPKSALPIDLGINCQKVSTVFQVNKKSNQYRQFQFLYLYFRAVTLS